MELTQGASDKIVEEELRIHESPGSGFDPTVFLADGDDDMRHPSYKPRTLA